MKREIIDTIISKGRQDATYTQYYKVDDLQIKIEIKSDSVDFQCYARAYVLKELEWILIYSIPYSQMKTPSKLYYQPNLNNALFFKDRDKLREKIEQILTKEMEA